MKKLSLLIALCMLLSIGGVYANWVYNEGLAGEAHDHVGSFGLSSATNSGSKGSLVVDASGASMTIDPYGDTYNAELNFGGTITVTFVPDEDWLEGHANQQKFWVVWALGTTNENPMAYEVPTDAGNVKLFTKFDTTTQKYLELTRSGDTFIGTIQANELADLIQLNSFSLSTYSMYTQCSGQIGTFGYIGITVTEKTN